MKRTLSTAIAVALLVTPAFAGRINSRRENQQDRIAQGVASGQLTPLSRRHQSAAEQTLARDLQAEARRTEVMRVAAGSVAAASQAAGGLRARRYSLTSL